MCRVGLHVLREPVLPNEKHTKPMLKWESKMAVSGVRTVQCHNISQARTTRTTHTTRTTRTTRIARTTHSSDSSQASSEVRRGEQQATVAGARGENYDRR